MNHQSNQLVGSMSSQGSYSTGSAQRNMQQSSLRMSMPRTSQFNSASSGAQSKPKIGYLQSELTEADNSNTVFIQHHESAASNGMQNSGSTSNYGMQNSESANNYGMQNIGSSGSNGMQNHGSSGSNGIQNQGSSINGMQGRRYESAGYY